MGIPNILGSLVNNNRRTFLGVFPLTFIIMEKKVRLYPTDNFKNQFYANITASIHLLQKKEGKQNVGFYRIRLYNTIVRFQAIEIRAIEVIEGDTPKALLFKGRIFIRYEVKPNPWGIEFLEYRRGEGFFAIGKKLDLLRTPPLSYLVK